MQFPRREEQRERQREGARGQVERAPRGLLKRRQRYDDADSGARRGISCTGIGRALRLLLLSFSIFNTFRRLRARGATGRARRRAMGIAPPGLPRIVIQRCHDCKYSTLPQEACWKRAWKDNRGHRTDSNRPLVGACPSSHMAITALTAVQSLLGVCTINRSASFRGISLDCINTSHNSSLLLPLDPSQIPSEPLLLSRYEVAPSGGLVQPGQTVSITVTYVPEHANAHRESLHLKVSQRACRGDTVDLCGMSDKNNSVPCVANLGKD